MKRSELRQMIREEYQRVISEAPSWDDNAPKVDKAKLNKEFGVIRKAIDDAEKKITKAFKSGIDIHVLLGSDRVREFEDEIEQALEGVMVKLMDDVRKAMK